MFKQTLLVITTRRCGTLTLCVSASLTLTFTHTHIDRCVREDPEQVKYKNTHEVLKHTS